jgi:hypothetical protein
MPNRGTAQADDIVRNMTVRDKLACLEVMAPDDVKAVELILDDVLRHHLKHIEQTLMYRSKEPH